MRRLRNIRFAADLEDADVGDARGGRYLSEGVTVVDALQDRCPPLPFGIAAPLGRPFDPGERVHLGAWLERPAETNRSGLGKSNIGRLPFSIPDGFPQVNGAVAGWPVEALECDEATVGAVVGVAGDQRHLAGREVDSDVGGVCSVFHAGKLAYQSGTVNDRGRGRYQGRPA